MEWVVATGTRGLRCHKAKVHRFVDFGDFPSPGLIGAPGMLVYWSGDWGKSKGAELRRRLMPIHPGVIVHQIR
jgi:hypothetical protein